MMNLPWLWDRSRLLGLLLLAVVSTALATPDCIGLKQPPETQSRVQSQRLERSGNYCLQEDLFVRGYKSWAEGGRIFTVSPIVINIRASDVLIDLSGKRIWSDGRLDAALETTLSKIREYEQVGRAENPPANVTLRNGSIALERDGIGIRFSGLGGIPYDTLPRIIPSDSGARMLSDKPGPILQGEALPSNRESTTRVLKKVLEGLPKGPGAYLQRNVLIEKMNISTQQASIVIQGAGTIIRDSVIEAQAGTAIWIYGPGALIENNTIIVHGRAPGLDPLLEADAPIRLIHADGAVVRNNRIVAADDAHHRAISVFDTGPIKVESNRLEGISAQDEWIKAFTGTPRVDAKENKFGPVVRPSLFDRLFK